MKQFYCLLLILFPVCVFSQQDSLNANSAKHQDSVNTNATKHQDTVIINSQNKKQSKSPIIPWDWALKLV